MLDLTRKDLYNRIGEGLEKFLSENCKDSGMGVTNLVIYDVLAVFDDILVADGIALPVDLDDSRSFDESYHFEDEEKYLKILDEEIRKTAEYSYVIPDGPSLLYGNR